MYVVIFNPKSYFQLLCTVMTMKPRPITSRVSDWPMQSQLIICERKLLGTDIVLFVKVDFRKKKLQCFLSKMAFERKLSDVS